MEKTKVIHLFAKRIQSIVYFDVLNRSVFPSDGRLYCRHFSMRGQCVSHIIIIVII